MSALTKLKSTASADEVLSILQRDGGVIIEDFLTADQLDGVRHDLLGKIATLRTGPDEFVGTRTRRMSALFAHSRHMADIATHPLFYGPAEQLINAPVVYWSGAEAMTRRPGLRIGATQLIQIGPGEGAQPLHRDDWAFLWRHPAHGREARLQIMVAISAFTKDNGGTLVIPGSHTWDDEVVPNPKDAISTEMDPGSALLWVGSLYHAGGTNITDNELRTGLTITLDAANVRQEENMYLALSPEVVKSYPEHIQQLLGWSAAQDSYMGWVEIDGQLRDPIELLR